MKLLFIDPREPNPLFGASHVNFGIINELIKKDIQVTQIASNRLPVINYEKRFDNFEVIKCRGIHGVYVPRLKLHFFSISVLEVMLTILRSKTFDIINSWEIAGLPLLYFQKLCNSSYQPPHIVSTYDTARMLNLAYKEQKRRIPKELYEYIKLNELLFAVDKEIRQKMEHRVYREADHLIVFCSPAKEALCREYNISEEKISIVPLGVDTRMFTPKYDSSCLKKKLGLNETFLTLTIGDNPWRKGFWFLLKAFQDLSKTGVKFKGIIQGRGVSRLKGMIDKLGLTKNVILIDRTLFHHELVKLYNLADLFVLPSVEEGFGLVVLESMACGTPVLVSSVGGFVDVVDDDCGIIVPPFDHRSISKNLNELSKNPDLILKMGKKARIKALKYTWRKAGEKYARICQEIACR